MAGYSSRKIEDLRPDVAANCKVFLDKCKAAGLKVLVTCTVRDKVAQEECYRKGTSKTKVPSFHAQGVGLAFDICQNVKGLEYSDKEFFRRCAIIGKSMGFEWGGEWKSIVDMPHFQWSGFNKEFYSNDILAGRLPPKMPYKGTTYISHTVQPGESFWKISRRYGINMYTLAKDNGLNILKPLPKGIVLKIYK